MDQKHWDQTIRMANQDAARTGIRSQIRVEKVASGAIHTVITKTGEKGGKR